MDAAAEGWAGSHLARGARKPSRRARLDSGSYRKDLAGAIGIDPLRQSLSLFPGAQRDGEQNGFHKLDDVLAELDAIIAEEEHAQA